MRPLSGALAAALIGLGHTPAGTASGGGSGYYRPPCSAGYRFDSYGRGLQAAMTGKDLRPRMLDAQCYQVGRQKGKQLKDAGTDGTECAQDFAGGYAEGIHASLSDAGTACFLAGYDAGLAALHVGAREGRRDLVSGECIEQYHRGKARGAAAQIAEELADPVLRAGAAESTALPGPNPAPDKDLQGQNTALRPKVPQHLRACYRTGYDDGQLRRGPSGSSE